MQADLICVGNELLTGLVENSNSGFLCRRLWSAGIEVRESVVIADQMEAIRSALDRALAESDLIIITGGLGPTEDDLTREAVAAGLNRPLKLNREWLAEIKRKFTERGLAMPDNNFKQAEVIEGGILLGNSYGTAPGMILEENKKLIVLLPGPPHEMQPIFDRQVMSHLADRITTPLSLVRTLRCIGLGESSLEETVKAAGSWPYHPLSYVARGLEVDLQVKACGEADTARKDIEAADQYLQETIGELIFGRDDDTLAQVVVKLLINKNKTLALAESCSGGLLSHCVTNVPGTSKVYRGGVVAYSRFAKMDILGIDESLLEHEGDVSEKTARAMAERVKKLFTADFGIGVTGIAGPSSDQSQQQVGLVYVALAAGEETHCHKLDHGGSRRIIKERSVQAALNLLRIELLK